MAEATVTYLRLYGDRSRDDGVVGKVLDATVELLREVPYATITTRSIAEHAGVEHADLCAYFRSKNAIVAEVYLELLRAAPLAIDVEQPAKARVTAQFDQLMMLLADEPTGDLDAESADRVFSLIQRVHGSHGLTSILVTHNQELAGRCDRVLRLEAGHMEEDLAKTGKPFLDSADGLSVTRVPENGSC